jgi:esterase/lipase superfamily enzyme
MPDIPGGAIVALGVLAALVVYVLVWLATGNRSPMTRMLVRSVFALALIAPVAFLALVGNYQEASQSPPERWPGSLGAETKDVPVVLAPRGDERVPAEEAFESQRVETAEVARQKAAEQARTEEGARMPSADDQVASSEHPMPASPPAAANGDSDHKVRPVIVKPDGEIETPTDAMPATPGPDAASRGASEGEHVAGGAASPDRNAAAATRSAASAETSKDWDVVPVFYGTDRQEQPDPKRVTYNSERGRRLDLGRALVTIPKIHQIPQLERPWAVSIPYFNVTIYQEAEDPKKHFTMQEIKKLSREELLRLVRERLAGSQRYKDHAIVFVHGYNTAFDLAVYRTAQISYDLKFDGAAFLYSWPSGGAVASYTYDRESAGASEPYLRQFLDMVVKETGAKAISLIGHSMGNQPLLEVLKDMRSAAPEGVVISQIICAAPDVDADAFANLAQQIEGFAKGVTLYAASNDRALIISRNFWQNPRAGDVPAAGPLIVPGIDSIDVTAASTDAFALNHSGYAENNELLQDIGTLILSGLRPPDQRLSNLKRVTTDKGDYWRYAAAP